MPPSKAPAPAPSKAAEAATHQPRMTALEVFSELYHVFTDGGIVEEEDEEDEAPLKASLLKDNIGRLYNAMEPHVKFLASVKAILHWKNPYKTLFFLFVYCFFMWHGLMLVGFLLSLLCILAYLYLSSRGLLGASATPPPPEESVGFFNRIKRVKKGGQKVQNKLGNSADTLEKINNVLSWKVPEKTLDIVKVLVGLLLYFSVLSFDRACFFAQVYVCIRIFFIDVVFARSARLCAMYDSTGRFFSMLPTNTDLEDRDAAVAGQLERAADAAKAAKCKKGDGSSDGSSSNNNKRAVQPKGSGGGGAGDGAQPLSSSLPSAGPILPSQDDGATGDSEQGRSSSSRRANATELDLANGDHHEVAKDNDDDDDELFFEFGLGGDRAEDSGDGSGRDQWQRGEPQRPAAARRRFIAKKTTPAQPPPPAAALLDRFTLEPGEAVINTYACVLVQRSSLFHSRPGRLYLTQHCIYFVRTPSEKTGNLCIQLSCVESVRPGKPIAYMPGGFIIDIQLRDGTEHSVSLLSRTNAISAICQAAGIRPPAVMT